MLILVLSDVVHKTQINFVYLGPEVNAIFYPNYFDELKLNSSK